MKRGVDALVDINLASRADFTILCWVLAVLPGLANSAILEVVMMVSRGTFVSEGGS